MLLAIGGAPVDALVWTGRAVVLLVLGQDATQVRLAEDQILSAISRRKAPMSRSQIALATKER